MTAVTAMTAMLILPLPVLAFSSLAKSVGTQPSLYKRRSDHHAFGLIFGS